MFKRRSGYRPKTRATFPTTLLFDSECASTKDPAPQKFINEADSLKSGAPRTGTLLME